MSRFFSNYAVCILISACSASQIRSPSKFQGGVPSFRLKNIGPRAYSVNVTVPLREIRGSPCENVNSDLRGAVALVDFFRIQCTTATVYQRLAAKGVLAVLIHAPQDPAGAGYYVRDSSDFNNRVLLMHETPLLEMSSDDAETLIEATTDGLIKLLLEPTTPNVWRKMYDHIWWILSMRALPASVAGTTAWHAYRTFMQRRIRRGEMIGIPLVVLLCEIVFSTVLAFICAMGAWFSTDNVSESVHIFFYTACPGGGLFTSLGMLFHWRQQMAISGRRLLALERLCYKRVGIFLGALAMGTIGIIDGAIALMACYVISADVLRAIFPFLVIVQLAVAAIFIANARQVGVNICAMLQSEVAREHRPRLLRLGCLLSLSGICMICQLAGSAFVVIFNNIPLGRFVGITVGLFGRLGASLAQVSSLNDIPSRKFRRQIHPFSSNSPFSRPGSQNSSSISTMPVNARPGSLSGSSISKMPRSARNVIKLLVIPKGIEMAPPDKWRAVAAATSSPPTTLVATLHAQPHAVAIFMVNVATGLREWSSDPRDDIEAEMLALPIEKLFGLWLRDLDVEPVGWRLSVNRLVPQSVVGCVANHFACQLEKVSASSVFACIVLCARDCNGSTVSSVSSSGVSSESMAYSTHSLAVSRKSKPYALLTAAVYLWIAALATGEAPAPSTASSAMDPPPPAICPVGIEIPTAGHDGIDATSVDS